MWEGRAWRGGCEGRFGTALEFAAVRDQDGSEGAVVLVGLEGGELLEDWLAGDEVSENCVFGVEVGAGCEGYEESGARRG